LVVRGGFLQPQLPDRTGDLVKMKDGEFSRLDEGTHD